MLADTTCIWQLHWVYFEHFVQHPIPPDDLVVIFQPAEEGPGGALPMLQSEVFQAWRPDHISPCTLHRSTRSVR